jgi:uncharacterized short protein YbdD (DUF466 family)
MRPQAHPDYVKMTAEEAEALKARVAGSNLAEQDMKLLIGLVSFTLWLQNQLALAKLSINRLKKLFGFSTEKKSLKQ